ncbi:MAPEG family protein [Aliivibrio kagoshimensis]|uniref:MAPEG family protein n=1 Tax=Aliivibrio kagoshimensis TaxID=2910230 RepID=UPI003D09BAE6
MSTLIFQPVIALMALTFIVWCYMYFLRLNYVIANNIPTRKLETPEQYHSVLPTAVNKPSNNLKNLFEMPILFYALCALSLSINAIDMFLIYLAWAFVVMRGIHSLLHCFSENVTARFFAYFVSSMILWIMVAKFCYTAVMLN